MLISTKRFSLNLLGSLLGIAALVLPHKSQAQQWMMATPYPETNFHTQNIKTFIEDVKTATGGKLVIALHANQTLFPMPEIKRAVRSGQAQMGEILLSAYGNEDPFFEVDGIPMIAPGYAKAKALWLASKPMIEKRFADQGLKPLFSVPWPPQGFYTKKPIETLSDLKGVKFRAYNVVTARMAEIIGAIPVTVQQAEVPQAFTTGMVSSMLTSAPTGVDTKAWEFSSFYYNVEVINNKNIVMVSQKALDALDAATRQAVLEAAAKAELRGWALSEKVMAETTQTLAKQGLKVEPGSAALKLELDKLGATMTAEWAKRAGPEGAAMLKTLQ